MTVTDYGAPVAEKPKISWARSFMILSAYSATVLSVGAFLPESWQAGFVAALVALFSVVTFSNITAWRPIGWRWALFSYPSSVIALFLTVFPIGISSMRALGTPIDVAAAMASVPRQLWLAATIPVASFFFERSKLVLAPKHYDND